jgi:hypothetical protein
MNTLDVPPKSLHRIEGFVNPPHQPVDSIDAPPSEKNGTY